MKEGNSRPATDLLVRETTRKVLEMLPKDPESAKEIAANVGRLLGKAPQRPTNALLWASVAGALLVGVAVDNIASTAISGLRAFTQVNSQMAIRSRVFMWPDGRPELYVLEDREGDPKQVLRVISNQPISHDRLEQIFERPVNRSLASR